MNNKKLQAQPVVGIYTGCGASHSWTWFADIFDKNACYSVRFLDEVNIKKGYLNYCDILFISGGDTFAIAEGLGKAGALEIERFVLNGGTYMGTCAGAYLPLRSSIKPLNYFNFVYSPITNLTKNLPKPVRKAEKFCTEYGCQYVYHAVREEVLIRFKGKYNKTAVKAPLYGGPALYPSEDIEILAVYEDFTQKTEFLIDEVLARKTIIGNVAAAKKDMGRGTFYLFGPHLEHPDFLDANRILFDIIFNRPENDYKIIKQPLTSAHPAQPVTQKCYKKFLSEISNSRIVALSLERSSYKWLIGKKIYDPEKIRVFLETIWKRSKELDKHTIYPQINSGELNVLLKLTGQITDTLRYLKNTQDKPEDTLKKAVQLFLNLRDATAKFLKIYFKYKRNNISEEQRRNQCIYTLKQQHCSTPYL